MVRQSLRMMECALSTRLSSFVTDPLQAAEAPS
jgi:hypothetical protein